MPDAARPASADQRVAWRLYVELQTRITTQALAFRHGDEATALKSVYDFFVQARESLAAEPGCTACAALVTRALNTDIRPFTAKWHRKKEQGLLGSADERYTFRRELAELQPVLALLAHRLGVMAGALPPDAPAPSTQRPLGGMDQGAAAPAAKDTLPFGIPLQGEFVAAKRGMNAAEANEIKARRRFYGLPDPASGVDAVGLAISGGGIRSATFALGAVQVLARRGLLKEFDYLSTVSGGGYLGSFISSVLSDASPKATLEPGAESQPFDTSAALETVPVRNLRNHSKYLSEGGLATLAQMAFTLVYGVATSLLLLAPLLALLAVLLLVMLPGSLREACAPVASPLTGMAAGVWLLFGLAALLFGFLRLRRHIRQAEAVIAALFAAGVLLSAAAWLPELLCWAQARGTGRVLLGAALLPVLLGAIGLAAGERQLIGRLALAALVLVGPLFVLAGLLFFLDLQQRLGDWRSWAPWALGVVLLAYTSFVLNLNFASLHRFYRDRLARTYLQRAHEGGEAAPEPQDELKLSALNPHGKAPYHLVNAALNLPGSQVAELRGRDCDFFVFSQHFCGSALTGWHATRDWEALDPHLDLGTAMAISGAAAAPRMGTFTSARFTALLALLNIRLGYWLKRPLGEPGSPPTWRARLPPVGWLCFARELLGTMSERHRCLNVSDGGHIENLGIYELLRRRCRTIIALDGEADPAHRFGGLLTLARMAKIDLGVTIEPDLADLRLNDAGLCNAHAIVASISYPEQGTSGTLLYLKLSLTGNEGEFLDLYRRQNPSFPHQSTAQQLFGESQFEAYRRLGEHAMSTQFEPYLIGPGPVAGVADWLGRLRGTLLGT